VATAPREADRSAAARAAWHARAAATADPQWARPGTAVTLPGNWDLTGEADADPGAGTHPGPVADAPAGAVPVGSGAAAPSRPGLARPALPALLAALGAVLMIAASAMTWATVSAAGLARFTVAGMDADQHGRLTFGLGLLTALAAVVLGTRPRGTVLRLACALSGVAGVSVAFIALLEIGYLRGGGATAGTGMPSTVVIGPGLWLLLLAGPLGVAAGVLALPGRRPLRLPPAWWRGREGRRAGDPGSGDTGTSQLGS
jgi:hypothetical protein